MLSICSYAEYKGNVEPLTSALSEEILATVRRYNEAGLRVIAVAHKHESDGRRSVFRGGRVGHGAHRVSRLPRSPEGFRGELPLPR